MGTEGPRAAEVIAQVARALGSRLHPDETLERITRTAVDTLPGVDHASVSLRHSNGRFETLAATDELLYDLDDKQYELREGPCFEAITDEGLVCSQQVGTDPRWPDYGPIAERAGIGSQLALEFYSNQRSRGGLNLYSLQSGAFGYRDNLVELFGTYAGVVMGHAYEMETIEQALDTRKVIGQALGILMERYRLSEERAFGFLVRVSQNGNIKLRSVADEVVARSAAKADRGD